MARRRAQWAARQRLVDPARLVFIDETWTKTNMAPLRGWSPRGERLPAKVPHGHWQDDDLRRRLRHDRVEAPWLLDWADQRRDASASTSTRSSSRPCGQGDIVVMDNLGSHKSKAVRRAIRAAGARLLLPAQILARPEPHRAALLKAQALAPTGRRPNRRCRLQRPRPDPRDRHPTRMLKLLHSRRVRTNVNSSRF